MKGLAASVLLLLPALAWLQYSWVEQIAEADRDRRGRTLRTAADQLAQEFDREVSRAVEGLQLDAATVETQTWSAFADRHARWSETAFSPHIVEAIYYVEAPPPDRRDAVPLRVWQASTRTFEPTEWPANLEATRTRFVADARSIIDIQAQKRGERFERRFPPLPPGDERTLIVPVMRVTPGELPGSAPAPPDIKLLGFQIIRLNLDALARDVLPAMVRRHFYDDEGHSDYVAAVVAREDAARVLYESVPGAAAAASQSPDATSSLLGPRMGPLVFVAREARRDRAGTDDALVPAAAQKHVSTVADDRMVVSVVEARDRTAQIQTRFMNAVEGHWRLLIKHRAGSLEAAVGAARRRNFALSSGILALLALSIGLIVMSARRADALARQQMEFVAAVSHELRTPVSVIGTAAGNLADGVVGEPARVKKYGETIQTEARRLTETVERVLQLAGIAAGRAAASPTIISPQTLVADALSAVRHEIDAAGVVVEVALPEALPPIRGDAVALRSAVQNLIGNAAKYSGEARWVRVSAASEGRTIVIAVEDRGLGIAAEDRHHIFEPFYRGREAVTRQIAGSGLGLHLVVRIAQAHGGSVHVDSEPGRGSRFALELPVAADAATPHAARQHPAAAGT
jgi:signal transduction histidine kinase